jgi:hypothetical protein
MQIQTKAAAPARQRATLTARADASRNVDQPKLGDEKPGVQSDERPAVEEATIAPDQTAAHDAPSDKAPAEQSVIPSASESIPAGAIDGRANAHPASSSGWSSEDKSAFQAMATRRKAAGFQRRGKDVGAQLLRVGDIAPNPGTVAAAIVALVGEHHTIGRGKLLDAMASATVPNAKAKPTDRGWCQGYVAGAVRDVFLAVVSDVSQEAGQ